ncbi:MAG: tetratricopeptide repeat protein [Promethearchaeota archaeon]
MKITHLTIQDLINENEKLTFLVGAGCSIDPPSCLPAGRAMIEAIINYSCAESEKQTLLELKELRFEQLVEIVRDVLDPELKIIDYYGQCDTPNLQHFFLADMIIKGQFVLTTNFDFLIEYALLQSNVPKDKIIPVITKSDFEEFNNPVKLYEKGKKTLYKIHGSTKNLVTGQDTRDSLIATIQAFGTGKAGENVFQVEPFKRTLFDNISNGRTLVIMGYSGSDDFDIVPTLKVLKNLRNIIWINYTFDDGGLEKIYEIDESTMQEPKKLDKVTQILVEIYRMQNADHVYRVDANTTRLIKELFDIRQKLSLKSFQISPITWLKDIITLPDIFDEFAIPYKIYNSFDMYQDAINCLKKVLLLSEKKKKLGIKADTLNNIACIHYKQGTYSEALTYYKEALEIIEELGNLSAKAAYFNNIGMIYGTQGDYQEALKRYKEAIRIAEQLEDLTVKSASLNNIGELYRAQGNYPKALKRYKEAIRIAEQLGDLTGKGASLNNMGMIYSTQGKYPEALTCYKETLEIDEQLGNFSGKATCLNNIGMIYYTQGKYPEALTCYKEALEIDEQLGNLSGKASILNNIGEINSEQGKYSEALTCYKEALEIAEQLGNLSGKATCLNNIGMIYGTQGNYQEALKRYKEAFEIDEQLGDLTGKAASLNNIGGINSKQGKYSEALTCCKEALEIEEQLENLSGKATCLNSIGGIYSEQGKYPEALTYYKEALKIAEQLGDLSGEAVYFNNIAHVHYSQKNYGNALKLYKKSLTIFIELGNKINQALIYGTIGKVYKEINRKYEAQIYLEKAKAIYDELGLESKPKQLQSQIIEIKSIEIPQDEIKSIKTLKKPKDVGRNDPCPCGSGLKYKNCCGKVKKEALKL